MLKQVLPSTSTCGVTFAMLVEPSRFGYTYTDLLACDLNWALL